MQNTFIISKSFVLFLILQNHWEVSFIIVNHVYFVIDSLQDEIWLGMQSNVWLDTSPRDFSNWRDPKFSDYPCIVMDTNQQWHPEHCHRTHLYVCKRQCLYRRGLRYQMYFYTANEYFTNLNHFMLQIFYISKY